MKNFNQKGMIVQLVIVVVVLLGVGAGIWLVQNGTNFLPKATNTIPSPIPGLPLDQEASLSLQSSTQSVAVGEEFKVDVLARSDNAAANLFAAKIKFPADLLEVTRIETDQANSIPVSNWAEKHHDNTAGIVSFTGGIPTPGYRTDVNGPSPILLTIYFKTKAVGNAVIAADDKAAVYRNSDNVNILVVKDRISVSITLVPAGSPLASPSSSPSLSPSVSAAPSSTPTSAPISSPTPAGATPSPTRGPLLGDGNSDGLVDLADLSVLLSDFNKVSGFRVAIDMNGDGKINTFDFSLLRLLLIELRVIQDSIV